MNVDKLKGLKLAALEEWSKDAVIVLNKTRETVAAADALMVTKGQVPSRFSAHLIKCIDMVVSDLGRINTIIECRK